MKDKMSWEGLGEKCSRPREQPTAKTLRRDRVWHIQGPQRPEWGEGKQELMGYSIRLRGKCLDFM